VKITNRTNPGWRDREKGSQMPTQIPVRLRPELSFSTNLGNASQLFGPDIVVSPLGFGATDIELDALAEISA
jgi:hypothetical protein